MMRAVYIERCTYGSERGLGKPTVEMQQGDSFLLYHFTSSGHFIVLRGVTSDGKILVADPASYSRSEKQWDLSIILSEASKYAAAGGPFWIIG